MKFKKKNRAPLAHSNLTEHENLRSHYDPNGSWTGVPDGWDKSVDGKDIDAERNSEAGQDVYGDYMPTENGYVQSADGRSELKDGLSSGGVEAGGDIAEYPLEGQVAPSDGDSYEQNTRDMQSHAYPEHTNGNGMADTEAGGDMYSPLIDGENGKKEKRAIKNLPDGDDTVYDDQAPMKLDSEAGSDFYHEQLTADGDVGKRDIESGDDIYQNDIEFDPSKYKDGEWKKSPEECPAPKRDVEIANDFYAVGDVGLPAGINGYPSVPDGELTMDQAAIKEDVVPVQDVDDL